MRLKDNELEQYGEAFIPEFVYEVIRRLSRFSTMRVGVPFSSWRNTLTVSSVAISKMLKSFSGFFWKKCTTNA